MFYHFVKICEMMPANLQSQLSLSFLVTGIFQSAFVNLDFVQNPMKHVMIAMVLSLNNCMVLDLLQAIGFDFIVNFFWYERNMLISKISTEHCFGVNNGQPVLLWLFLLATFIFCIIVGQYVGDQQL